MTLKFFPSDEGFLGLSGKDGFSPQNAKAWIIPFALESSVSYGGGTAKGPEAIIEASHQVELFDESFWKEPFREYGVATAQPVPHDSKDLEESLETLENAVRDALEQKKFPLVLGGEHSLTPGAIRPFVDAYEKLTILQFDAHADLRNGYDGEHFSHAAAMCRCLDRDNVHLVSVGIRNISAEEIPFLEANKDRIDIFWAKDKSKWSAQQVAEAVGDGSVYITFDLDGFDSSLMPATGTPEPGGLFWQDVMDVLEAVSKKANIVGADIVELAPKEGLHACDFLAAKLTYKILSYAFLKPES
ncbi:MAG: agmatinase [Alphaproteobacteria bacterium]|nr:agmatinase [Alphaproteobacteria bacterium]